MDCHLLRHRALCGVPVLLPARTGEEYREVPIYGVNQKDREAAATGFIAELGNPFTALVVDPDGRQSTEWGVYGLPETFVDEYGEKRNHSMATIEADLA